MNKSDLIIWTTGVDKRRYWDIFVTDENSNKLYFYSASLAAKDFETLKKILNGADVSEKDDLENFYTKFDKTLEKELDDPDFPVFADKAVFNPTDRKTIYKFEGREPMTHRDILRNINEATMQIYEAGNVANLLTKDGKIMIFKGLDIMNDDANLSDLNKVDWSRVIKVSIHNDTLKIFTR